MTHRSITAADLNAPIFPEAKCRGVDPELWFPNPSDDAVILEARSVCRNCPVAMACFEWGATSGSVGIWGGVPIGPGLDLRVGARPAGNSEPVDFFTALDIVEARDVDRAARILRTQETADEADSA